MKRIVLAVAACAGVLLASAGVAGAAVRAPVCGVADNCIRFTNVVVGGPADVRFHVAVCRGTAACTSVRKEGDYAGGQGDVATFVWGGYSRFLVVTATEGDAAADLSQYDTTISCTFTGSSWVAQSFVESRVFQIDVPQGNNTDIGCTVTNTFIGAGAPAPRVPQGPDRFIYCAAAGDTDVDGNPIVPGTALNLLLGQPLIDAHYAGATPAFWIAGVGATCSLTSQQAALAAASTTKVNHVGGTGDVNQPDFYTLVG